MNEKCKICGHRAHGNHFGVVSCRACAAFFRRTANSKWSKMTCRKKSCDSESRLCKPCRVKKCRDMGMNTKNFQYNRDLLSELPQTIESYVGRPECLLFCDGSQASGVKLHIDVQHLLDEASRLLNHGPDVIYVAENQLKKLTLGFQHMQVDPRNLKKCERAGQEEIVGMWGHFFVTVTKWISYFDDFHKLHRNLQLTLLQSIWHVWSRFYKISSTSAYRRINGITNKSMVVMKNLKIDAELMQLDFSWVSDYPAEDVMKFMEFRNWNEMNDPIEAMTKLAPTDVELTFMFAQLCFEYAGKRHQGEIQAVTDRFQEVLANDMHVYYVHEQRRPRYFHRMAKLMKMNNSIQKHIWKWRPIMEVGRVFNVFKLEFSHPEMFVDSGWL